MHAHIVRAAFGLFWGGLIVACGSTAQVPEPKPAAAPTTPTLGFDEPAKDGPLESGLIITASPDVEIQIDGESKGTTPLDIPVPPGVHSVVWLFEGDNQVTMEVELSEGEFKRLNQNISPDASDAKMGQ
ncbi:MAG: PEGA domain-containing protein [Myxococcota bacterium]